ncbi:MAG: hypothetical protein HOW97_22615 [Catenulispora sp.]|nr:hypothetical protein [Catenulispora sp.]
MSVRIPARLRAPLLIAVAGLAVGSVDVARYGWAAGPVVVLAVVVVGVPVVLYRWGARDTDSGAAIRRQLDERQAFQRLRVQALVGRVMTLAAAGAFLGAVGAKATLWPFAVALALPVLSALVGRAFYGDRHQ